MQAPSGAQMAAFAPQAAFPEQLALAHAGPSQASPDPYTRFLDRSSIYYGDTPTPRLRSPDVAASLSGYRAIGDWTELLLPQPLHYEYPHDPFAIALPDMPAPAPDPAPSFPAAATGPAITQSIRNACANPRAASRTSKQEGAGPRPREKKHGCWMCEKSFDRPSTLRKVRTAPPYNPLAHPFPALARPHRRKGCVRAL